MSERRKAHLQEQTDPWTTTLLPQERSFHLVLYSLSTSSSRLRDISSTRALHFPQSHGPQEYRTRSENLITPDSRSSLRTSSSHSIICAVCRHYPPFPRWYERDFEESQSSRAYQQHLILSAQQLQACVCGLTHYWNPNIVLPIRRQHRSALC